jgi:hypothetical protein
MLFPALQRARRAAQNTVCLNNLRSQQTAVILYAHEYDGYFPNLYMGTMHLGLLSSFVDNHDVFNCPLHVEPMPQNYGDKKVYPSYGASHSISSGNLRPQQTGKIAFITMSMVRGASHKVFMMDRAPYILNNRQASASVKWVLPYNKGYWPEPRHGRGEAFDSRLRGGVIDDVYWQGKVNVGTCSGGAEGIAIADLLEGAPGFWGDKPWKRYFYANEDYPYHPNELDGSPRIIVDKP